MKPLIVLAGAFGAISLASFVFWANAAVPVAPPTPTPTSVTILEPDKNHGTVKLNESILDTFIIVNPTDRAIAFNEPMKSCTCTAAELDRRELGPGESGKLTVSIQTGSRRVPRVETVGLLYTIAGEPALHQLFAKMYFVPKGVFETDPVDITLTSAKPKASFVIRIDPTAEQNKVLDVRSNHRCVKIDTSALPTVSLELDLNTPDESILNTECLIYTNNAAEGIVTVPVRVRKE